MALRNQPYLPLYVQDFLTDEKLAYCSASATGVYIRIMCLMHKSEKYGTILLKQNFKQVDKQVNNFALQLAKQLPYDLTIIQDALNELISEGVLHFEGDSLVQKRMVKDSEISELRKNAGSVGGKKTQNKIKKFDSDFALAKFEANAENENENKHDIVLSSNVNNKGVAKIEKNLPAKRSRKTELEWNENDPEGMVNLPGEAKMKLSESQFLQVLSWQGKRPCPDNELVWLSDAELERLIKKAGDKNIALKAIENLHEHKQEKKGVRTYSDDSRKVCGWALDKARQSAKIAGYDPSKERQKEKIRKDNLNLFNEA
jgi:Zn-finger nucleic acid-binding protein